MIIILYCALGRFFPPFYLSVFFFCVFVSLSVCASSFLLLLPLLLLLLLFSVFLFLFLFSLPSLFMNGYISFLFLFLFLFFFCFFSSFPPSRIHFLRFFFSVVIVVYLSVTVYAFVSPAPSSSDPSFLRLSPSLSSPCVVVMVVVCPDAVFVRSVRTLHLAASMHFGRRLFGHSERYSAAPVAIPAAPCILPGRCRFIRPPAAAVVALLVVVVRPLVVQPPSLLRPMRPIRCPDRLSVCFFAFL